MRAAMPMGSYCPLVIELARSITTAWGWRVLAIAVASPIVAQHMMS